MLIEAIAAEHASAPPPVVVVCMNGLGYIIGWKISSVVVTAETGITPPPRDLAVAITSGTTFQWSTPHSFPVRARPVWTSSAINSTPYFFVAVRIRGQKSSGGTIPPASP